MIMKKYCLFVLVVLAITSHAQNKPVDSSGAANEEHTLTPNPFPKLRVNNALAYGCEWGSDFLYRIPCQGERPITFSDVGLPWGFGLDKVQKLLKVSSSKKRI